jgi:hypothetical protein
MTGKQTEEYHALIHNKRETITCCYIAEKIRGKGEKPRTAFPAGCSDDGGAPL